MNHRLEGGGFCNGLQALVPAKAGRMIPAPSGLQEVDGLNRLLQIVIPQQTADRYRGGIDTGTYIQSFKTYPFVILTSWTAALPDQIRHSFSNQHRSAVLRRLHQMQMCLIPRARRVGILSSLQLAGRRS